MFDITLVFDYGANILYNFKAQKNFGFKIIKYNMFKNIY